MRHRRAHGLAWLGIVAVAGCAALQPAPLPPLAHTMRRDLLRAKASRCARSICRTTVNVGDAPYSVEANARLMSRAEALGERRSMPAVVGGVFLGEMLLLAGASVGRDQVGLDTRTVTSPTDASMRLDCRNGWLQEEMRTRHGGSETITVQRLAEGMDCELKSGPDSVVTWRFHAGSRAAANMLVNEAGSSRDWHQPRLDLNLRLEQVTAREVVPYRVALDSVTAGPGLVPLSSWGIERPDGTRVATLLWRYGIGSGAIDWTSAANEDERRVLSFAAAALTAPLMETR